MAIEKNVATPNGATGEYHELVKVEVAYSESAMPVVTAYVMTWRSAASRLAGDALMWVWPVVGMFTLDDLVDLQGALTTKVESPFYEGFIINGAVENVETARARRWKEVQLEYRQRDEADLQTMSGIVQCDSGSQNEILKAVVMANNLAMIGETVAIDFTLANNTVVTLDAEATIGMGFAMAGRQQALRARMTELRSEIAAAQTIDAVKAITWGTAPNGVPA